MSLDTTWSDVDVHTKDGRPQEATRAERGEENGNGDAWGDTRV